MEIYQKNSKDTVERAQAAQVTNLPTDTALVQACDVILSVVPPRDAEATAQRLLDALALVTRSKDEQKSPLYFADLNAVSPGTIQAMARRIEQAAAAVPDVATTIAFIDGAILGGPPRLVQTSSDAAATDGPAEEEWQLPQFPTSGPVSFVDIPGYGPFLAAALGAGHQHISPDIGAASGLKMCYASLTKGYAAIATQAYATAQQMGVLPALRDALPPARRQQAEQALVGMPPKAWRWVREMDEIARTHAEQGGWGSSSSAGGGGGAALLFTGAAGVFRAVAEDTALGTRGENEEGRKTTAEDVAVAMAEGLGRKRKKLD